jgi:cytidine deaminase
VKDTVYDFVSQGQSWRIVMPLPTHVLHQLISAAREASTWAYCPYSKFRVGAALLTAEGKIVSGCNVENASYGLTVCAERTAVYGAVAQGHQRIQAIVIYTPTPIPSAPCGACRQVLNEFAPEADVISICDGRDEIRMTARELFPKAFGPHNLA